MEEKEKEKLLESFMKEFFDFNELKKVGFFKEGMRYNYKAQAERVCKYFGYKTVYEYGAEELRCHLSFTRKHQKGKPFITVIENIYT